MKTLKVKAQELLSAPTPFLLRGIRVHEICRVSLQGSRVIFYTLRPDGTVVRIASSAPDAPVEIIAEDRVQNADHLLDTIGRLHARNKSLQKGNATLTRRVQELEQQYEDLKKISGYCVDEGCDHLHTLHQCFSVGGPSDRAVDAIIADVMAPLSGAISHADTQLEQDLAALQKRVNGLEDAALYAFASSGKGKGKATELLEDAITRGIGDALKAGGPLRYAIKNG